MGFFVELADGIANGFRASASQDHERGRIERFCRELGWAVDEREGDVIRLHFKDSVAGTRKVFVTGGDSPVVLLAAYSFAILPAARVPAEVTSYLLARNVEIPFGSWQGDRDDDDDVVFGVRYVAIGRGLTAESFKFICEGLVREAMAFDERMCRAGLLGS